MDRTPASLLERLRIAPDEQTWARLVDLYTPLLYGWTRGTLVTLRDELYLAVSAEGHYRSRGPWRIERELVYVVQTEHGQDTLTPEEFAQKYGWKNDPDRVRLADQ
jgi:hypothetical protein